ncbi:helix-turn-helix domain-containing protein [Raoultibacter phocaeensis]|uniref:helix-turn-helix domain-containing protein n=1 Tax=Raoultibacter phocaeensis TaxID=2479841 RepID=UPI00111B1427|nr:helix-turn-helix domain-containing protein [Raoultibacter phocaeensis]
MFTVKDTACELGVTEARVRAMLSSGILEGEKVGRMWFVYERSVQRRKALNPHAGRPRNSETHPRANVSNADVRAARNLYRECEDLLAGCYDARFLDAAASDREERFYVHVANFFLQEKQRELIEHGVF